MRPLVPDQRKILKGAACCLQAAIAVANPETLMRGEIGPSNPLYHVTERAIIDIGQQIAGTRSATHMNQRTHDHRTSHPLQSSAWGEFRNAMGVTVIQIPEGQLTIHPVPHTPFTVGYFPKGPFPTADMIAHLKETGARHNTIFIQLEPDVQRTPSKKLNLPGELIPSHHPLFTPYTHQLDLTKSEDALLQAMHSKTRYNIRLARRHGVMVSEDNSPGAFRAYLKLSKETTERQGFFAHNTAYHKTMWRIMHETGIAHLFTATYQNEILAAWIIFAWNDKVYYPYGASSRKHRNVMAPTLLLWEIALWAKKHGYKAFDLWGALGPDPDPKDPWIGFHRFKEGFAPALVEYIGSYDLVLRPALYQLYRIADRIRWTYLRLTRVSR